MIWLLLFACDPFAAFENDPPRLLSANGVEYSRLFGFDTTSAAFQYTPGEDFEITLEFDDPEGQDVEVWWPKAPGGWEFDPHGATGVWHVPSPGVYVYESTGVLVDDHEKDPGMTSFTLPLFTNSSDIDTGFYGE